MVCFMQVLHNFEVCSGDPVDINFFLSQNAPSDV